MLKLMSGYPERRMMEGEGRLASPYYPPVTDLIQFVYI